MADIDAMPAEMQRRCEIKAALWMDAIPYATHRDGLTQARKIWSPKLVDSPNKMFVGRVKFPI